MGVVWWLILACTESCFAGSPSTELTEKAFVYSRWETFTAQDGLPGNDIRAIRIIGDQVWVGTNEGLARLNATGWKTWAVRDGLPVATVTAIDVDPVTDEVWLGTWGGGLVRFSAGRMDVFNQRNSGLAGDLVLAVLVDGDRVWAASNGGINAYERRHAAWNLYDPRRADVSPGAITGFVLNDGAVYAAAWRAGIRRYNAQRNDWLPVAWSRTSDNGASRPSSFDLRPSTLFALVQGGGHLWWATQDTLSRQDASGRWSTRRLDGWGGHDRFVQCLAASDAGRVALGADTGLVEWIDWDGGAWLHYRRSPSGSRSVATVVLRRDGRSLGARALPSTIPDNGVQCIAFGPNEIWVGTANGLALGSRRVRWNTLPRAPTNVESGGSDVAGRRSQVAGQNVGLSELRPSTLDFRSHAPWFSRTAADGAPASSVAIGLFGPRTKTVSVPGRHAAGARRHKTCDLLAAQLAIDGANSRGGYHGRTPYDLALRPLSYANYGWGLPEDDLLALASHEDIVGIVGLIEPDDRLTDLVVLRTKVPVVNVGFGGSPDAPSSGNPWVFRCVGDRPQQYRRLLDMLFDRLEFRRPAVLCSRAPEACRRLDWWKDHATRRGHPLVATVPYDPGTDDLDAKLLELDRSTPDVLLTSCGASVAAAVVRRMRALGMNQLFVGTSAIVSDTFIAQVGPKVGPVAALYTSKPPRAGSIVDSFSREYAERSAIRDVPQPPPTEAYRTMDAVNHLLTAIERAGPDREAIREELARMSHSAEGEAHFERTHEAGTPVVAWLKGGQWRFEPIE